MYFRILHWRILSARLNVPFYHRFFSSLFLPLFDKEYRCREFRKCCISLIITHSGNPMHSIECILILGYSVDNFYYSKKSLFGYNKTLGPPPRFIHTPQATLGSLWLIPCKVTDMEENSIGVTPTLDQTLVHSNLLVFL